MKFIFYFFLIWLYIASAYCESVTLPVKALPSSLDIDNLLQVDHNRIASLMSEPLFEIGDNFEIIPKVAKSYYWNKKENSIHISIRSLSFSNGRKVEIEPVIESIENCIKGSFKNNTLAFSSIQGFEDYKNGRAKKISGIQKTSHNSLKIKLISNAPLLLDNLSQIGCSIVLPNEEGERDLLSGAIGSGPYLLEKIDKEEIVLKINKRFHQKNEGPLLVRFKETKHYGDFETLRNTFDLILTEKIYSQNSKFSVHNFSNLSFYNLTFNNKLKPFDNIEIRKAISLGLDYHLLAKSLNWPPSRLQGGLFPFGMRGFRKRVISEKDKISSFHILKKYGYNKKNPLKIKITAGYSSISLIEKKSWPVLFSNLPIQVTFEVLENNEFVRRREKGDFQLIRTTKVPGSLDPHLLLASYISGSKFNTARSTLPKCDSLIKRSFEIYDTDKRFDAYKESEDCLINNYILIPLASSPAGSVLVRKPWKIARTNQYLLYPYSVHEWKKEK